MTTGNRAKLTWYVGGMCAPDALSQGLASKAVAGDGRQYLQLCVARILPGGGGPQHAVRLGQAAGELPHGHHRVVVLRPKEPHDPRIRIQGHRRPRANLVLIAVRLQEPGRRTPRGQISR